MKKTLITLTLAGALFTGYSVYESQKEKGLTDAALANVEALAQLEGNECHYSNGVTNIQLDPSFWHTKLHHYYDCCAIQVDGYNHDGECN